MIAADDRTPVWVKVCGLTRSADVEATIRAGADAIGLVLVDRSPRRIDRQLASELASIAKDRVEVVVLTESDVAQSLSDAFAVGATTIQPYGSGRLLVADAALAAGFGVLLPMVAGPALAADLASMPPAARPLIDAAGDGRSGGTGTVFDWRLACGISGAVIAGGLDASNVAEAIAVARPWGVDASSRLEAGVGVKDHVKVNSFITAAKAL